MPNTQVSVCYSAHRQPEQFRPHIYAQPESADGQHPAHYQLWLDDSMCVVVSLSDVQCRQLMDVLGSRPDLPKTDARIDAKSEPLDPMPHQERNAAVAEPLRSIVNSIGGENAPF